MNTQKPGTSDPDVTEAFQELASGNIAKPVKPLRKNPRGRAEKMGGAILSSPVLRALCLDD